MKTARNNLLSIELMKTVNLLRKNRVLTAENGAFIVSSFQEGNYTPLKNLMAVIPDSYVTVKNTLTKIMGQVD